MDPQHPPQIFQLPVIWPAVWGVWFGGHHSSGTSPLSSGLPAHSATPQCVPVATSVWGARLLELGRRFLGGVGQFYLRDVKLRGNFSVLADTSLSNVSRNRQTVFVLIEAPWSCVASLYVSFPTIFWQVYLQSGSALESVKRNPHLAWLDSNWLRLNSD